MRVRFPLAWIIIKKKRIINLLIKENAYAMLNKNNKPKFFYSFKFSSMFHPGSLKNINLFLRSSMHKNEDNLIFRNGTFKNNKILVKQSYLLIKWIHYLCNFEESKESKTAELSKKPSFFIHPYSQSKTTLIKAPLAHKTFSQEQFFKRYYKISVSFVPSNTLSSDEIVNSVNGSIYCSIFIRDNLPMISTNLLFLKRTSYSYNSTDSHFYSYHFFSKNKSFLNKVL